MHRAKLVKPTMILRIERVLNGKHVTLRLIGHLCSAHLTELQALIEESGSAVVLDLNETTLVDVDSVNFLRKCRRGGMELRNCSPYICEWMDREQAREA